MEKNGSVPPTVAPDVREKFYHFLGQAPETEAGWAQRQEVLQTWRSDARFQPYWPSIDHMLADDYLSFKRRAAALASLAGDLEGYDFDACREQRAYDLKHAHDHLP